MPLQGPDGETSSTDCVNGVYNALSNRFSGALSPVSCLFLTTLPAAPYVDAASSAGISVAFFNRPGSSENQKLVSSSANSAVSFVQAEFGASVTSGDVVFAPGSPCMVVKCDYSEGFPKVTIE